MRDLTAILDGIRVVRRARRRFLRLWQLERLPAYLAAAPAALDRLAADIAGADGVHGGTRAAENTAIIERTTLKTRTTWLFPHGRMADEW